MFVLNADADEDGSFDDDDGCCCCMLGLLLLWG